MTRRVFLPLLLLALFLAPCSWASELEPVMFVTGVVHQDHLAEVQAELARQRKEVAENMLKAVAAGEEAAQGQAAQTESAQAQTNEARAAQAAAARELAQISAKEEALAQALADATQQVANFGAILANTIKKELACARVIQKHELAAFMAKQREIACGKAGTDADPLDGTGKQEPEEEYEVTVTATIPINRDQAGPVEMTATCTHKKTSTVLASVATKGGDNSLAGLADTFVGQMARFEVCPYLGTVSVSGDLMKDHNDKAEHQVYCNKHDGRYLRDNREHSVSKQQWELEKTGRRAASGDVNYAGLEQFDAFEENDCYRCSTGQEGRRVSTKKTRKDFSIKGLSEESAAKKGETVNKDSRIRIRFLDNGYYMIKIDAVSKTGTELVDLYESATGACDPIDRDPPPEKKGRDEHLIGEWGPFRGTPLDKHLADKFEEPLNNPAIGETGKRTIRFDLNRK